MNPNAVEIIAKNNDFSKLDLYLNIIIQKVKKTKKSILKTGKLSLKNSIKPAQIKENIILSRFVFRLYFELFTLEVKKRLHMQIAKYLKKIRNIVPHFL